MCLFIFYSFALLKAFAINPRYRTVLPASEDERI